MKRSKFFNIALRLTAGLVCGVMLVSALAACSKEEPRETSADTSPILECEGVELPLFFYEFMLSRVRGNLAREGHKVTDPDFWYQEIEGDGRTVEEYYNDYVLGLCKNYLAALIIFEREELSLPESTLAEIDEEVQYYIDYDGKGDEAAFSESIRRFGIDAEALRRCYVIEKKYDYLMNYLYGDGQLIGDVVREEYYDKYYLCFNQILILKYKPEFQKDSQGNVIYFDSNGKPLYDKKNGSVMYNADGSHITDSKGQSIYYDETGRILYDVENGKPSDLLDKDGNPVRVPYTDTDLAERLERAEELAASLEREDFESFEKKIAEVHSEEMIFVNASEKYYVSRLEEENYFDYPYMKLILAELEEMAVGEISMIESRDAYHVIMKYDLEDEVYKDSTNADWFTNLDSKIILDLFRGKMADVLPKITENSENLAKARSITRVGTNYDY